jgi:hypothetical protein
MSSKIDKESLAQLAAGLADQDARRPVRAEEAAEERGGK